jgi:hypothetical protein
MSDSENKEIRMLEEGDGCYLPSCSGIYGYAPVKDCSCHISPPCNQCVENPIVCSECGSEPA